MTLCISVTGTYSSNWMGRFGSLTPELHRASAPIPACLWLGSNAISAVVSSVLTMRRCRSRPGSSVPGFFGMDILGRFDLLFDVPGGRFCSLERTVGGHGGSRVVLTEVMGIPILDVIIARTEHRMFFDTGAQVSYFEDDSIADFPAAGTVTGTSTAPLAPFKPNRHALGSGGGRRAALHSAVREVASSARCHAADG